MRRINFHFTCFPPGNLRGFVSPQEGSGARIGATPRQTLPNSLIGGSDRSALVHRYITIRIVWAQIFSSRPNQPVVVELLTDVRRPAADTGNSKHWGKLIFVDAQYVISGRGVEIYIGVQLLFGLHKLLYFFRHLIPLWLPAGTAQISRHRAQVRSPRIFGVIHAMAEARNLF